MPLAIAIIVLMPVFAPHSTKHLPIHCFILHRIGRTDVLGERKMEVQRGQAQDTFRGWVWSGGNTHGFVFRTTSAPRKI